MAVQIDAIYDGNLISRATHGPSRQTVTTDAPVDNGGRGSAFSPTDLLATAFATCMLTIMGLVAQKRGVDIAGTQCTVTKEMVADPVRRVGKLTARIVMPQGRHYDAQTRKALEEGALSCPVKQSLHPDVILDVEFVYPD
ncbi:MAG: OsmC family protein [Candidatus Sumerlaeaceae bacterium]|jgi:putative redox protein